MHRAFLITEIYKMICEDVAQSDKGVGDLVALAATCKALEGVPLDIIWGKRPVDIVHVLKTLPRDSWVYTDDWAEVPAFVRFYHFLSYNPGKC